MLSDNDNDNDKHDNRSVKQKIKTTRECNENNSNILIGLILNESLYLQQPERWFVLFYSLCQ